MNVSCLLISQHATSTASACPATLRPRTLMTDSLKMEQDDIQPWVIHENGLTLHPSDRVVAVTAISGGASAHERLRTKPVPWSKADAWATGFKSHPTRP